MAAMTNAVVFEKTLDIAKSSDLNKMAPNSLKNCSEEDIKRVMEILLITEDINLQVKLFNILAAHVMANSMHKEQIITNDLLYEKIYKVLNKGHPAKTARTLDFVSALLYCEEEAATRGRSLALRARRSLRTSGCLPAMAHLFTTDMMHQETWGALCRCLAETCRDSVENQSYCSHLVPLCVQKCIQGSLDTISLLKSLIDNHSYNINLFFESNGIRLFERKETLQNDLAMQLLSIVIQHTPVNMLQDLRCSVSQNLEYYKELYGADTKTGQWAVINLYELDTRIKKTSIGSAINCGNTKKRGNNGESTAHSAVNFGVKTNNTTNLIQNVLREIEQFQAESQRNKSSMFNNNNLNFNGQFQINKYNKQFPIFEKLIRKDNTDIFCDKNKYSNEENHTEANDMSFSFLLKQQSGDTSVNKCLESTFFIKAKNNQALTANQTSTRMIPQSLKISNTHSMSNSGKANPSMFFDSMAADESSLIDFKPLLVSTPKQVKRNKTVTNFTQSFRNRPSRKLNTIKRKHLNYSQQIDLARKPTKQRSISSRVFNVINESCTTFVKTFKNIFKTKNTHDEVREHENSTSTTSMNKLQSSCSYSFTKYMHKRESVLSKEKTINTNSDTTKLCKSCNDTGSLKRKVIDDSCLKETVSKLKLGINIYGCDFRKISKAMWPREPYMTPEVLYNLYRKLIAK